MRRLLSAFFLIWPFSYLYFLMSEGGSGQLLAIFLTRAAKNPLADFLTGEFLNAR